MLLDVRRPPFTKYDGLGLDMRLANIQQPWQAFKKQERLLKLYLPLHVFQGQNVNRRAFAVGEPLLDLTRLLRARTSYGTTPNLNEHSLHWNDRFQTFITQGEPECQGWLTFGTAYEIL